MMERLCSAVECLLTGTGTPIFKCKLKVQCFEFSKMPQYTVLHRNVNRQNLIVSRLREYEGS